MSETSQFFELNDDVGLAPPFIRDEQGREVKNPRAGERDPIRELGLPILIPVMAGTEVVDSTAGVVIKAGENLDPITKTRVLPDSRIIETRHPGVANHLIAGGYCHEIDPPKSEQPRRPKPSNPTGPDAGEKE